MGRADFRFAGDDTRIDKVVTLLTKAAGTSAELLGCHPELIRRGPLAPIQAA
ncbi:hypothetical protein STENM327S_02696 [Streptomyces tendae]